MTRYDPPPDNDELPLANDAPGQQKPAFDATLVDSRPLGDWQLNASAAVIRLDCPMIKPDVEGAMLVLRPSYTEAIKAARQAGLDLLPSANMLDASAKQFDDGMYAALDLACFRGDLPPLPAAPAWLAAVWQRLPADSTARPFLAAALELAGRPAQLTGYQRHDVDQWLGNFDKDKTASKPIGFYDWTPELTQVWRFYRFLQHEFKDGELAAPRDIAAVLKGQPELQAAVPGDQRLLRPAHRPLGLPLGRRAGGHEAQPARTGQAARRAARGRWPSSRPRISRETELFERMFAFGLPTNLGGHDRVNLMAALIQRIRSGRVDLKPRPNDGWYQYQVYALETLLLPTAGPEKDKLLLTAEYKKRLMEAFQAIVTKQRETQVRQLDVAKPAAAPPGEQGVAPRLRVEPCPTFYLRTARAYAFIRNFLHGAVGPERLGKLHGLRSNGQRDASLDDELDAFARRFYGFYLLSCEDIGMRAKFLDDEPVDQPAARQAALRMAGKAGSRQGPGLRHPRRSADLLSTHRVGRRGFGPTLACGWPTWKRPTPCRPRCVRGPGAETGRRSRPSNWALAAG